MFAVVANGLATICKTQRELQFILAIYPYPKFQKCRTKEEASLWLRQNSRTFDSMNIEKYGDVSDNGYVTMEYFIVDANTYYNFYTEKVGRLRIHPAQGVAVDNRNELIKVKVYNSSLDTLLIQHNVVAIERGLNLIGEYVDVNIVVPDISVYLAITKYSGRDFRIQRLQRVLRNRLGAYSITVKENIRDVRVR